MLTTDQIKNLFSALNDELKTMNTKGEIGICSGAVMCLVFKARHATKDIDAIFEPTQQIRKAAEILHHKFKLPPDWLNDAAKGFFLAHITRETVLEYSHLKVWAPSTDYMLAMKCISARFDSLDKKDVIFLIKHLKLKNCQAVFEIIQKYYPKNKIPPKTQFLVEEIFS